MIRLNSLKDFEETLPINCLIALDVEATGTSVRQDQITEIGVFFKAEGKEYGFIVDCNFKYLHEILERKRVKIIGWNAYYDLEIILHNDGIDLWHLLYAEVMMLKHTIDEHPPFGLKECGVKYFGNSAKDEQIDLIESIKLNGGRWTKEHKDFYKADPIIRQKYCLKDCALTYLIYERLLPQLSVDKTEDFFFNNVMDTYRRVTRELQSSGMHIDVPAMLKAKSELSEDLTKLYKQVFEEISQYTAIIEKENILKEIPVKANGKLAKFIAEKSGAPLSKTKGGKLSIKESELVKHRSNPLIGFLLGEDTLTLDQIFEFQKELYFRENDRSFNLNSDTQMRRLFFDILKIKPLSFTDGGQPQVNSALLSSVVKDHPWAQKIIDIWRLEKMGSTYIDRFLNQAEDGIFYPWYKQHGTTSGRYSGDFQQLPKEDDDGVLTPVVTKYRNMIRNFFIAPPGYKFVVCDFESLEPHIFAHISGEAGIKEIFNNGWDFYSKIAIDVGRHKDVSADKKAPNYFGKLYKGLRQFAKAYVLGIPYGMGAFKLSETLKISREAAEKLIKDYFAAYPNLYAWFNRSQEEVLKTHRMRVESGRVLHFPEIAEIKREGWHIPTLLDSLLTWKAYHEEPVKYEKAKSARRKLQNAINRARNGQIQGLAAAIVDQASKDLISFRDEHKLDAKLVLQVHDELGMLVREDDTMIEKNIESILVNAYKISLPLKAPPGSAKKYGDAKKA